MGKRIGHSFYYQCSDKHDTKRVYHSVFYAISAQASPSAVILNVGDRVTLTHELAEDASQRIINAQSLTITAAAPVGDASDAA